MGRNWIREYEISCGPKEGGAGFSTNDLRIEFSVKKTEKESCNTAQITLWNLNEEHENVCCAKDCQVILRAGYRGSELPVIFKGYVTYGEVTQEGADKKTAMELTDGSVEVRDSFSSESYSGTVDAKTVIENCAQNMGLDVKFAEDCKFGNIPNGYSFIGRTTAELTKMCDVSGLHWYIDNGVINVKKKQGTMSRQVYILNSNTGLVGRPTKITEAGKSESDKKVTGYNVEYFLNADIKVGDYVNLDSEVAKGFFRVESLEISGDNFGGDWLCKATLKVDDASDANEAAGAAGAADAPTQRRSHSGKF